MEDSSLEYGVSTGLRYPSLDVDPDAFSLSENNVAQTAGACGGSRVEDSRPKYGGVSTGLRYSGVGSRIQYSSPEYGVSTGLRYPSLDVDPDALFSISEYNVSTAGDRLTFA